MLASTLWFPIYGREHKQHTLRVDLFETYWYVSSVSAAIARGKRPVTFRTRKLRLSAPMVLQGGPCGRVGHRRTYFAKAHPFGAGPSAFTDPVRRPHPCGREVTLK